MLTRKQHELLLFINQRLEAEGVSPSFDEKKEALGMKSKSGIHRLISGLEERGFIRRLPHRARALEVTRLPENQASSPHSIDPTLAIESFPTADESGERTPFAPRVIRGDFSGLPPGAEIAVASETMALPMLGKIAAGTPIEALRDPSRTADVPASLLGSGEHYALEVEGDSMVEAGIHDGDVVVIRRGDTAENGAIVVALVDDNEVTLNRLRRKGESIALEPANVNYETRIFGPGRVRVQGRLVGLIRKY